MSDPRCYHGVVDGYLPLDDSNGPPRCKHCWRDNEMTSGRIPFDPEKMRIGAGGMVEWIPAVPATLATDPVNHPPHYQLGGIEVIDAIEAWGLGFCLGNAVKYIARAGKKDPARTVEDLKKARWYLDREIARMEKP